MDNLNIGSVNNQSPISGKTTKPVLKNGAAFNTGDSFTRGANESDSPVDLKAMARSLLSKLPVEVAWNVKIGDYLRNDPVLIPGQLIHTIGNNNEVTAFSPDNGAILWRKKITKDIGAIVGKDGSSLMFAADWDSHVNILDPKTGNKLWTKDAVVDKINLTPVSDKKGILYFIDKDSKIQAVDGKTGKKKWKTDTGNTIQGTLTGSSDDSLYISNDEGLSSIDTGTGKLKWKSEKISFLVEKPVEGKNDSLVYTCRDGGVGALNAGTGKNKWQIKLDGETIIQSPVTTPDGTVLVINLNKNTMFAFDGETGKNKWKLDSKAGDKGTMTFPPSFDDKGRILLGDTSGRVSAIDPATGEEVWGYDTGGGEVYGKPVFSQAGFIYFNDTEGNVHALNSDSGKPVWKCSLRKKRFTSPIILSENGMLYTSTHEGEVFGIKGPEFKEKCVTPEESKKLSIEQGEGFVNIGGVMLKKHGEV